MKSTKDQLDNIYKKLRKDVEQVLKKDVAQAIIDEECNIIDIMVYQEYTPTMYTRREENDGLIDKDNYKSSIVEKAHSIELNVENQTMANPWIYDQNGNRYKSRNANEYLLPIVENAGRYDFPETSGVYDFPKPIRETTVKVLKQDKTVEEILGKQLRDRGWDIE